MKCTARKTDGKSPCKAYAIRGKDKCRVHGGLTPIKHGLYSKYCPPSLKEKIEDARADPEAQSIESQILFQTALMMQLLSEVQDGDRGLVDETVNSLLKISQAICSSIERNFKIEKEARELITGGKIEQFIQSIVLILKRVVDDESISRKGIPAELAKRVGQAARVPGIAVTDNR